MVIFVFWSATAVGVAISATHLAHNLRLKLKGGAFASSAATTRDVLTAIPAQNAYRINQHFWISIDGPGLEAGNWFCDPKKSDHHARPAPFYVFHRLCRKGLYSGSDPPNGGIVLAA
jgi:hypothetical protein